MPASTPAPDGETASSVVDQADVVMAASRVFVAISAESLEAAAEQLDLSHFRALVVLASHDGMSLGELAEAARIHASRASRICDRLVDAGLVTRVHSDTDRRQLVLSATRTGRKLVDQVWTERRRAIIRILGALDEGQRGNIVRALRAFVGVAGERSDHLLWEAGWTT